MKTLLIIALLFTFSANAQSDTTTSAYIQVPPGFVLKYNNGKLKVGASQFNAVQDKNGNWFTAANAASEFPIQMSENPSPHFTIVRKPVSDFVVIVSAGTTTKTQ